MVISKKCIDSISAKFRIKKDVSEYYQYNKKMDIESRRLERSQNKEKWVALEEDWLKLNCDGAFDSVGKKNRCWNSN